MPQSSDVFCLRIYVVIRLTRAKKVHSILESKGRNHLSILSLSSISSIAPVIRLISHQEGGRHVLKKRDTPIMFAWRGGSTDNVGGRGRHATNQALIHPPPPPPPPPPGMDTSNQEEIANHLRGKKFNTYLGAQESYQLTLWSGLVHFNVPPKRQQTRKRRT